MPLTRDQLLQSYRQMKTIREFEERLHVEIQTGEIPGFTHLYSGQEAVAVGVCEHLSDADWIASTHRGHGHCIAKGCDVPGMMLEIYGRRDGLCKGKGGSMHIADIDKGMLGANAIVGGGPPIAVGAAIACKTRRDGHVAVAFGGDGSCNQGTVFEAMNMAVVLQAPAIFVFENNGYCGAHRRFLRGRFARTSRRARAAFGMPARSLRRRRLLRRLRGRGPGRRAGAQRRRSEHHRGEDHTVLRALRGRPAALPRQGRGRPPAAKPWTASRTSARGSWPKAG